MRLYAYVDRFDCDRFGVVVADDRFLTGRQLERFGGLPTLSTHMGIANEIRFDRRWQRRLQRAVERCLRKGVEPKPLASRRPAAAIVPGKIVCVGLNYRDHVAEGRRPRGPEWPLLFAKFANAVIGDGEPIVRPEGRTPSTSRSSSASSSAGGRGGSPPPTRWPTSRATSSSTTCRARDWQGIQAGARARARRATASGCGPRAATRSCRSARSS